MKIKILVFVCILGISTTINAQYIDLPADINWNQDDISSTSLTLDKVELAYNNARTLENTALGTSIPMINFPDASIWNTWSNNRKAFWILNEERTARGLIPFENYEQRVIDVAQNYCQYLVDNDTSGHVADGHSSNWRLLQDPLLNATWESTSENISYYMNYVSQQPQFVVERLIYSLIYEDIVPAWGHRHNFFISTMNDNSGENGKEGIIGFGVLISQGYKTSEWCAVIVYNFVDPDQTWVFTYDNTEINNMQYANILISKNEIYIPNQIFVESYEIIDTFGRKVQMGGKNISNISINNLPKGGYILVLKTSEGIIKEVFIK